MLCPTCKTPILEVITATDGATILVNEETTLEGCLQASGCCADHELVVRAVPDLLGIVPLYTEHACPIVG